MYGDGENHLKSKNFDKKVSQIRSSQIRVSQIRASQIRASQIRASEISSNHRELHGAIFFICNQLLLQWPLCTRLCRVNLMTWWHPFMKSAILCGNIDWSSLPRCHAKLFGSGRSQENFMQHSRLFLIVQGGSSDRRRMWFENPGLTCFCGNTHLIERTSFGSLWLQKSFQIKGYVWMVGVFLWRTNSQATT